MRKVSIRTFEDDGCWWCQLIEHGKPVPEGHLPNLSQALRWTGPTEQQAVDRCKTFLRQAMAELEGR